MAAAGLTMTLKELIRIVEHRSRAGETQLGAAVALSAELGDLGDELVNHYVLAARERGCSWLDIGQDLGVTRQAAHKRFGDARRRGFGVGRLRRRRCEATFDPSDEPFSWFSDRAKDVVSLTQHEARRLGHNYLGTEHLLLGLMAEGAGVAAEALRNVEVSAADVRRRVEIIVGRGTGADAGAIPFTPRTKKVLELSRAEAKKLKHNHVGTEHLLLALVEEGEGLAAQILTDAGVSMKRLRGEVLSVLSNRPSGEGTGEARGDD